jgi:hypothetical protein
MIRRLLVIANLLVQRGISGAISSVNDYCHEMKMIQCSLVL